MTIMVASKKAWQRSRLSLLFISTLLCQRAVLSQELAFLPTNIISSWDSPISAEEGRRKREREDARKGPRCQVVHLVPRGILRFFFMKKI